MRRGELHLQLPLPNQHSDFIHPFEFVDFMQGARAANLRSFDIMLEAKAKELAVVRLRQQVARYAPELAAWVTGRGLGEPPKAAQSTARCGLGEATVHGRP